MNLDKDVESAFFHHRPTRLRKAPPRRSAAVVVLFFLVGLPCAAQTDDVTDKDAPDEVIGVAMGETADEALDEAEHDTALDLTPTRSAANNVEEDRPSPATERLREFRRRGLRFAPKEAFQGWQMRAEPNQVYGYAADGRVLSTAELLRAAGETDVAEQFEFADALALWSPSIAAGLLMGGMAVGTAATLAFTVVLADLNPTLALQDVVFLNSTGMLMGAVAVMPPVVAIAIAPFLFRKPGDEQVQTIIRSYNFETALEVGLAHDAIPAAYLGAE